MTIRLHREGIGTFEADTAQEMVALVAAMQAQLSLAPEVKGKSVPQGRNGASVADDVSSSPTGGGDEAKTASSAALRWTRPLVRELMGRLDDTPQNTIVACVELGDGASSQELADLLGKSTRGLGSRMHHIAKVTNDVRKGLPPPVTLVGDHGDKRIEIDPDFLTAYKEEI